jgi:hypothetical protein
MKLRSRMCGAIPPFPNTPSCCGVKLKHRDNFTFTLYKHLSEKTFEVATIVRSVLEMVLLVI